jgi:hypothetical protein
MKERHRNQVCLDAEPEMFVCLFGVLGIKPKASCMLGNCSATEMHPVLEPELFFFCATGV